LYSGGLNNAMPVFPQSLGELQNAEPKEDY
jgi:hypothetical protein